MTTAIQSKRDYEQPRPQGLSSLDPGNEVGLREVLLSPSCGRKKKKWPREFHQDFTLPCFPRGLFKVSLDGHRERGTTRSLKQAKSESKWRV